MYFGGRFNRLRVCREEVGLLCLGLLGGFGLRGLLSGYGSVRGGYFAGSLRFRT